MKKFKCPVCNVISTDYNKIISHIEDVHSESIPENMSTSQWVYYSRTGKEYGKCVECGRPTEWNESTKKYKRFCPNPKCRETYVERMKEYRIAKYGKAHLLNDPDHQRKMLANRSISKDYKWSSDNKIVKTVIGTYELDFIKFLDVFMNFAPEDIMCPSPHTYYYKYENKDHFYIPDFYIASLDLEIEIKDGGDNPNTHHKIQNVDKVKEKLKDDVMSSLKDRNYMKIENKKYAGFMTYLRDRADDLF